MFMQDLTRLTADATPMPVARALPRAGLVAGTLVETDAGWRAVELLSRGDRVQSFDGGLREIVAIDRDWLLPGTATQLVRVPGGVMGNCAEVLMMPGQTLLVDTWDEADLGGAVVALVPAAALIGLSAVAARTITKPVEIVAPVFAEEEVIRAQGGMLLHCPGTADLSAKAPSAGFFTRLPREKAHHLLAARLLAA